MPGGLFARIYQLARRWDGGYPSWFTEWVEAERRAISLHTWQPLLIPGLLQTPDYARALFQAWRSADSDEELDQLVSARIERQAIFEQPKPPSLWAVIDEGVLTRCIGSAQTMRDQLEHLMDVSDQYKITVQVVPVGCRRARRACWARSRSLPSRTRRVSSTWSHPTWATPRRSHPWSRRSARPSTCCGPKRCPAGPHET